MKILLTGGCGFIGSNILKSLVCDREIEKILVIDNLVTGKLENIEQYLLHSKVEFINDSITDFDFCKRIIRGIDVVCHQAALGSVPRSILNPIDTNITNIDGTLNLLIASKDENVKRFIFAASSSTYGDSNTLPKQEHIIGKPMSPYAVTKYVNELYADVFYKIYGLNYVGLRYFNVFGPNQDPNSYYSAVIPKFCYHLLNNETITINGDGFTSRDFTFVENVVHANILAIKSKSSESLNQIYNVGCGKSFSLLDIVNQLFSLSNNSVPLVFKEERVGDIKTSIADITKIQSLLGYNVQVEFIDGIKLTWEYYLNKLNNKN